MKTVSIEEFEFANRAAKHFGKHPEHTTYSDKEIEAGCYFALRWGLDRDCVLVLKIDDDVEPSNYNKLI